MQLITLSSAALLALGSSAVFAQQAPETGGIVSPPTTAAPAAGGPLVLSKPTGLDKVAADGTSTITVRAVPCRKAAWETDGTTTCVGIPEGTLR